MVGVAPTARSHPGLSLPPNLEAIDALGCFHRDIDAVDLGGTAAGFTPLTHRPNAFLVALEDGFDTAVIEVFHPAVDAALTGGIAGAGAVVDALDATTDEHVGSDTGGVGPTVRLCWDADQHTVRRSPGRPPPPLPGR